MVTWPTTAEEPGSACAEPPEVRSALVIQEDLRSRVRVDLPRLAFRELPTLLRIWEGLRHCPEVVVCDGYGIAHPRRFGLACHFGVLTGVPTFGVGKTAFVGEHGPVDTERGSSADLVYSGEVVGRALRTVRGVNPVFVSAGHLIDLAGACALTLDLTSRFRLPETTRRADQACRAALRAAATDPGGAR